MDCKWQALLNSHTYEATRTQAQNVPKTQRFHFVGETLTVFIHLTLSQMILILLYLQRNSSKLTQSKFRKETHTLLCIINSHQNTIMHNVLLNMLANEFLKLFQS